MEKFVLTKEQVQELVWENRYPVTGKNKFLSRCIDGRYQNSKELAPLAIPGADAGELALIFATANSFGLTVDKQKALDTLTEVVGGAKNFQFHSDRHGDKNIPAAGCGHIKQMNLEPQAYFMEKEQLVFITESLKKLKQQGAAETILEGDHGEGAVLQIEGNYSVSPRFTIETGQGKLATEVFVYQASLVDQRHKELAKKLLANGAVNLFSGADGEYLHEALEETAENHLLVTAKRLAEGLPIYLVKFKDDGSFKIEEMGRIA